MKKLSFLLLMLIALCGITSCTESSKDFYQYINEDSPVVFSVDAYTVLENAGFEFGKAGVEAPSAITKHLSKREKTMLNNLLEIKGIDPRKVMVAVVDNDDMDVPVVCLAKILDKKAFTKSLEDNDLESINRDELTVYYKDDNNDLSLVIDDNMLVMLACAYDDAARVTRKIKREAEKSPLKAWQQEALGQDHTCNLLMNYEELNERFHIFDELESLSPKLKDAIGLDTMLESNLVASADLKGTELNVNTHICDDNGKTVTSEISSGKIDDSMLRYADALDFAALLLSLPKEGEWRQAIISLIEQEIGDGSQELNTFINALSGTLMMSFGYDNIQSLMAGQGLHGAIAVGMRDGQGKAIMDMIKGLLNDQYVPYTETADGIAIALGHNSPTFYLVNNDGNLVLTTSASITGEGCKFKASDFGNGCTGFIVEIPSKAANITYLSLPFGIYYETKGNSEGSNAVLRLTDVEGGLIENIIKVANQM